MPQDQVFSTKIYVSGPQGQRAGNKRKRQEIETREKKRRTRKDSRDICPRGTKDSLWIERRQKQSISKGWLLMVKREKPSLG